MKVFITNINDLHISLMLTDSSSISPMLYLYVCMNYLNTNLFKPTPIKKPMEL